MSKPTTISILSDLDHTRTEVLKIDGRLREIMRTSTENNLTENEAGLINSMISDVIDKLITLNRSIRGTE